ncbi:VOC family protein [Actinophytocola oryzae]|uniref:PhnB protein n=1 Tax=Actinophytocola oryzae TaxID=502181 RepID=A0A4R7VSG0_9PSEU|nr:VOC family protein [Actinophytocola oryzae]TDV52299.1 PhnB protein [Actinophytocola oryzae]
MTDSPAPKGSPQLTTFFTANDAAAAIDFYVDVFGAELVARFDGPDGRVAHAEMRLGDSPFQLGEASPDLAIVGPPEEGNNFTLTFWTSDPDAVFARAVAAGATAVSEVDDVFSGDRMGVIRDPAGIRWCLSRHDRDVSPQEIADAAAKWMAEQDA